VRGVIADKESASADNIVSSLRTAFEDPKVKGVILRINSPGGSPVQSGYVYDEIRRLRSLHPQIKLYAVISDLGASGAYYIASAADQIYADKASLGGFHWASWRAGYGFGRHHGEARVWSVAPTPRASIRRSSTRSSRKRPMKPSSGRACSTPLIASSLPASSKGAVIV